MANYNRSSLVLSVNRALWGAVTPSMRQVATTIERGTLAIEFLIDSKVDAGAKALADEAGAKAHKDFPELKLKVEIARRDAPEPLILTEGWNLVYRRWE